MKKILIATFISVMTVASAYAADSVSKDAMQKDEMAMKKDAMQKDKMNKEKEAMQKDAMSKQNNEMKKDGMSH